MKTTTTTFTLLASLIAGCADSSPATAPAPSKDSALEQALADADTGKDVEGTRSKLEGYLTGGTLSKEQQARVDGALARLTEPTDKERAIRYAEDAVKLGDEAAEKLLYRLASGRPPPSQASRLAGSPIAPSALALAKYYPAATPERAVSVDVINIGGTSASVTSRSGAFAVGQALHQNALEACGMCDDAHSKVNTRMAYEGLWSGIPRHDRAELEKALVVLFVDRDTMVPQRYAEWMAVSPEDAAKAIEKGEGLVAVKERGEAPPLVTLVAPRAAQFGEVESAFAAMSELPKTPVTVNLHRGFTEGEHGEALVAIRSGLRACYEALHGRHPGTEGDIDADFKVDPTGQIATPSFKFNGLADDPEFRSCATAALGKVRYPATKDAKRNMALGFRMHFAMH